MKWSNVKLIFKRELRDQLRDRRTLFTIAVMPMLLYPLLGTSLIQITQFIKTHPTKIWVLGAEQLTSVEGGENRLVPPLIKEGRFIGDYCTDEEASLLQLEFDEAPSVQGSQAIQKMFLTGSDKPYGSELVDLRQDVQDELAEKGYDILVFFPDEFTKRISESSLNFDSELAGEEEADTGPQLLILVNSANAKSRIARDRVDLVINRWRRAIVRGNLEKEQIAKVATEPFQMVNTDVSAEVSRRAAVWSKILPFVMLIWALTGAFYPAIDLCAGEKERGTLETLLSSPASRSEIVWGKLFTIMSFSVTTAMLNMISMGLTGLFVIKGMGSMGLDSAQLQLGPPPLFAFGWLVLLLLPISALFSALSLAIAAFARSSKEGQYYLMPLLVLTMPLMMLPMLPAAELNLGTALIPVTGTLLLLRKLIEGQYNETVRFFVPVLGVTAICCLISVRWAITQFKNESVLFRENERFGLGLWMRHLVRDRGMLPTAGEAVLCGVLILVIRFFVNFMTTMPNGWGEFAKLQSVQLIAFVATPACLMAIMLTRSPRKSLSFNRPSMLAIPAAFLLAVLINPAVKMFGEIVVIVYPVSEELQAMEKMFGDLLEQSPNIWAVLLVIAFVPAVCEEIAFRGFILTGLRTQCNKGTAIVVSSLFFGLAHSILQQSIVTFATGCLIGYIAVQSRSIWPCIVFHFTNNALAVLISHVDQKVLDGNAVLALFLETQGEAGVAYRLVPSIVAIGLACVIIYWFTRQDKGSSLETEETITLDDPAANAVVQ